MKMKRSDAKPTSITYLSLCFGNCDKGAPTSMPEQALEANLSPVGEERVVTWVRF